MPLVDGPHVILECSNCGAPLIDIWITEPSKPFEYVFVAKCPHCGDKSFEEKVSGGFRIGSTDFTSYERFDIENGKILVETKEIKKYE